MRKKGTEEGWECKVSSPEGEQGAKRNESTEIKNQHFLSLLKRCGWNFVLKIETKNHKIKFIFPYSEKNLGYNGSYSSIFRINKQYVGEGHDFSNKIVRQQVTMSFASGWTSQ